MAGTSKLTAVAVAALGAFGSLFALSAAGSPIAPRVMSGSAAVALLLALAAAGRTLSLAWRGPVLVQFARDAAMECNPVESAEVRAAAQLRGTLGGAGHVHPRRLAFPAAAWIAAAAFAGCALGCPVRAPGWPASLLVLALLAFAAFPAVPFWYREAHGGVVLLYPRAAFAAVVRRSRSLAGDARASSTAGGWGSSPSATESGAKAADVRASRCAGNRP